jgi:apolipoprotein N-acyltransferase
MRGPAPTLEGWEGIDTFGGKTDESNAMRKIVELPRLMRFTSARVAVYPETVAGLWMPGEEEWWARERGGGQRTALIGAEVLEPDGKYANAVIEVSQTGSRVVYRQRMPVPLTMWRPWAGDGAHAYWFQNPVAAAAGKRAAVLICYEQTIVWPVLCSMAGRPDVVIACSNDWWCCNSEIPTIQRNSVTSWCRLFNVPLVMAVNR